MYKCKYVCIAIAHTHTHTHTHTRTHTHTHTHTHTQTHSFSFSLSLFFPFLLFSLSECGVITIPTLYVCLHDFCKNDAVCLFLFCFILLLFTLLQVLCRSAVSTPKRFLSDHDAAFRKQAGQYLYQTLMNTTTYMQAREYKPTNIRTYIQTHSFKKKHTHAHTHARTHGLTYKQ